MSRPRTKPLPQTSMDSNSPDSSPPSTRKRVQLTRVRELKGLTQQELADLLGTTALNVSRWERGVTRPTPYFRTKLTTLFGKSEEELDLRTPLAARSEAPPSSSSLQALDSPGSASPSFTGNSNIENSQKPRENALNSGESLSDDSSSVQLLQPVIDPATPHAPVNPLVGRDGEILTLKEHLQRGGNAALTALNGLPGVGKTALSITIANDKKVREYFHDGVLWAALGPHPDLTAIMSRWSKLLGVPEAHLPDQSDIYAWSEAVNNTIGSRTMLIVIDDAWELDHALPLRVGGPNCAHLITTRYPDIARDFIGETEITTLHELDDEESMKLLLRLAPNAVKEHEDDALTLIRAVGGLPLALTLVGNYLSKEAKSLSSRRIRDAYTRLSKAAARLNLSISNDYVKGHPSLDKGQHISLQTLFAVTDERLTEAQRTTFYTLSVFPPKPGDFSEDAALAIAQCDPSDLDALSDTGLLENKGKDCYTLHQTIADYAHLKLEERGTQQSIQERLIAYALDTLKHHRKDYDRLERDQSIILQALETAHTLNLSSELIQGATGFTPFLLLRALYDHARTHLTRAHEHALATHNQRGIISTHLYLGELALRQSHYDEANKHLNKGLTLARKLKDKELICDLLDRLGGVAWKQGKNKEAQTHLEEGLHIARELGDIERTCNLLKALDLVVDSMGESEQGLAYLEEGVSLARRAENREQLCVMLMNLGVSVGEQGKHLAAKTYFQEALDIAEGIKHKEWTSALLSNLGSASYELGNYEQAENYFIKGIQETLQIYNREWLSLLYINLGMVMREQKRYKEAKQQIKQGIDIALQIGIPYIICNGFYEYGVLSLRQQDIQAAENAFYRMFDAIPKGDQELDALAKYGLAQVAQANGHDVNAQKLATKSRKTLEDIGHRKADEVKRWIEASWGIAC